MKLHNTLLGLLALGVAMSGAQASSGARAEGYRVELLPLPPGEARGCYYYRQRRFCGRYCYYEANGMRYCQERAREAYPQAPVETEYDGPEDRRVRHRTLK